MRSKKSKESPATDKRLSCDLQLPVFDAPLIEPWPRQMSWSDAVRSFAPTREHYMREFDSPEQRWHDKNPVPFHLS